MPRNIRILALGDSHFSSAPNGRLAECVRVHNWVADLACDERVDLVLHSGDLYDRRSTVEERQAVADWVQRIADHCPMVIARGNHDALGDLPLLSRLKTTHRVFVEEAHGVYQVAGVVVGVLAWPRRGELVAAVPEGVDIDDAARAGMRAVLEAKQLGLHNAPTVLLAHAMVRGSMTSTGQPLIGSHLEIGLDDLASAGAKVTLLGHIHAGQEWAHDGRDVVYSGSPYRTSFGEVEPKGVVLIDFVDGSMSWRRVETPATPMLLLEGSDDGEALTVDGDTPDLHGAECRFRYTVDAQFREGAKFRADAIRKGWLEDGALSVKVEAVTRPTCTARVPEVAKAVTVEEKIEVMWDARGELQDPEERARVLALVSETEVAA